MVKLSFGVKSVLNGEIINCFQLYLLVIKIVCALLVNFSIQDVLACINKVLKPNPKMKS